MLFCVTLVFVPFSEVAPKLLLIKSVLDAQLSPYRKVCYQGCCLSGASAFEASLLMTPIMIRAHLERR